MDEGQAQGERKGVAKQERGTERQAVQRRRWREGRCEVEGGLRVQFCILRRCEVSGRCESVTLLFVSRQPEMGTYTTDDAPAASTIADQIPSAGRHLARDQVSRFAQYVPSLQRPAVVGLLE